MTPRGFIAYFQNGKGCEPGQSIIACQKIRQTSEGKKICMICFGGIAPKWQKKIIMRAKKAVPDKKRDVGMERFYKRQSHTYVIASGL